MRLGHIVLTVALTVSAALAVPAVARAHNGTGGASSDYRIEITGFDGDPTGIDLRVVELGSRLELHRTSANEVVVLGYSGEPYLRLDDRGVYENENSPAHYLNLDRFASTDPPASASATAEPRWVERSTGSTVRWHDHRAHWMSSTPRPDVRAEPDAERVIFEAAPIDLVVDGRAVTALVRVTWLPTPDRLNWMAAAALAGLVVAGAFVLRPRLAAISGIVAIDAAIAVLLGQGESPTRLVISGALIVMAAAGFALRRPIVSVASAAAAGLLAATRLEVYEHELLAGWLPGPGQRIAIAVAIALSLGVVAPGLVGALGPSQPEATPPTEADRAPLEVHA